MPPPPAQGLLAEYFCTRLIRDKLFTCIYFKYRWYFLVKEYLVAVRIADMKVVILAVNMFLLKYSFVLLKFP